MKWGVPALECRSPQTCQFLIYSGCHKFVSAGLKHTLSGVWQAIQRPMPLTIFSQNNIITRYRNPKRSIILDPLPRRAKAAEVDKVFVEEGAAARRKKNAVGLRDMTSGADDILRNRVLHVSFSHRPPGDEFEDVVVGAASVDRLAFEIDDRLARPC